jgi:hypothetical protein
MIELSRRTLHSLARAAAVVSSPLDIALDRFERWAARNKVAPFPELRVTCVFLQWDREKGALELDALVARLRSLKNVQSTVVLVDNRASSITEATSGVADIVVPGDNEAWEFSGFQAGLNAAFERHVEADIWILANDRYRADGHPFLDCLTPPTLAAVQQLRGIIGHIDRYPKAVSSFGFMIGEWIATSFFIVADDVLRRSLPMVRVDRNAVDTIVRCGPAGLSLGPPVGVDHARYLLDWLTGAGDTDLGTRWYGSAPVDELDANVLRRKVQSILNEQLLSAAAMSKRIPLVPIRTAFRLGRLGLHEPAVKREIQRIAADPRHVLTNKPRSTWLRLAFRRALGRRSTQ